MTPFDLSLTSTSESIENLFAVHPDWNLNGSVTNIEKAGEGNMNVVLRITLDQNHSVILKQAKPFVNKYPSIPAPINRIEAEVAFYHAIGQDVSLKEYMPACLGYDAENHLMVLADLGKGSDYTYLYQKSRPATNLPGFEAIHYLSKLHHLSVSDSYPDNMQLRLLNAVHLFDYPFQFNPGFDLDQIQPGLQSLALPFWNNATLGTIVQELKREYLSPGLHLLHGDFYPGSWLKTTQGFKVIDPEFSYIGHPAFDLGVMIAHFKLARIPNTYILEIIKAYDHPLHFDHDRMWQFAGIEVIRRLIGLAQVSTDLELDEKQELLRWAQKNLVI